MVIMDVGGLVSIFLGLCYTILYYKYKDFVFEKIGGGKSKDEKGTSKNDPYTVGMPLVVLIDSL